MPTDSLTRSWAKALSWRISGIAILGAITYLATSSWKETGTVTVLFHSIRVVLYYLHERFWDQVGWGKLKHPLACLPVRNDLTREDYETIRRLLDEHHYSASEPEYQI